jgi:hypothetical protein
VLDLLGGCDEGCVQDRRIRVLFHHLLALFDQAGHSGAPLPLGRNAEQLECLVQPFDLSLGLLEMLLEG